MRWSIIRLIFLRELRDQLRDRRTMFVMVLLPLLLYPLAGIGLMQITLGAARKPGRVGVVGAEHLPRESHPLSRFRPLGAWLSLTPEGGPGRVIATSALVGASHSLQDYPPLLIRKGARDIIQPSYFASTPG